MNEFSRAVIRTDEASNESALVRDPRQSDAERRLDAFLQDQEGESALSQYLQILLRRRWIVMCAVAAALMIAMFLTFTTVPLYRAASSIEIDRASAKIVSGNDVDPPGSQVNQEFYQTQYGLLKSRALAETVVRKLRLGDNEILMNNYKRAATVTAAKPEPSSSRLSREQGATSIVMNHLEVTPVRASSLVTLTFDSPDKTLSAQVVNAIADAFIDSNLQRRYDATAYARQFLEARLEQVRHKLEDSERNLVEYAAREQIINLDAAGAGTNGATPAAGQSLVAADLTAINASLAQAKTDRVAAQAIFERARAGSGLTTSQGSTDTAVAQLRGSRAQLQTEYSKNLSQFKPDYPQMQQIKAQIAEIDKQLAGESGNIIATLRNNYEIAMQRESRLQAQVNGLKGDVLDLRRRSIQYNIYQRDADTNRTLYDGLLQRYKEIGVAGGIGTNNVSIVDRALPPGAPFTPKTIPNLLLGLLGGLLVGGMLAFMIDQLDESIISPHDLEKKLGIPLLGSIPLAPNSGRILEMLEDRKSGLAEAYLSVQTALRFSTPAGAPRALLVTSARASEGKSTTAFAVAQNFATLGYKAVLIDADMRRPSIHKLLGLPNVQGLSDALAGSDEVESLIQRTPTNNLFVMPSGPMPPNPSELLATARLAKLVDKLLEYFDHVVIDSPPVMGLADAPLISSHVQATMFVIVAKETRAKAARVALRRLSDVHAHLIGAVLTKFDSRQSGYEYGYSYYGYGQEQPTLIDRAKRTLRL
ncbi:MAG: polysaccharide biosynthesis tyrosine autokinase [Sphingomonas sp.]